MSAPALPRVNGRRARARLVPPPATATPPAQERELERARQARDAAVAMRDHAIVEHAEALARRDAAVAERDRALESCARAIEERDEALAQRDEARAAHARAREEAEALLDARDRLLQAHAAERAELEAELETLRGKLAGEGSETTGWSEQPALRDVVLGAAPAHVFTVAALALAFLAALAIVISVS